MASGRVCAGTWAYLPWVDVVPTGVLLGPPPSPVVSPLRAWGSLISVSAFFLFIRDSGWQGR